MRLSYSSLFPDKVKHDWCKRKRLSADNPYDLPVGDYCIYDLYSLSGIANPDIYLTVENRKSRSQSATLRCLISPQRAEILLSAEHLQSPEAPAVCQMVRDIFKEEPALRKKLLNRKREVQKACENVVETEKAPETEWLSEITIRRLAGTLEQVMQASTPENLEQNLDQLLADLRQSLLESLRQQAEQV